MTIKEFFKPTKQKIIIFIIIAIVCLLSHGLRMESVGNPLTSTQKVLNTIPAITSPGINALLKDNGFFISYKPDNNIDMTVEIIFHICIDIIYWYILASIVILLRDKIKSKHKM